MQQSLNIYKASAGSGKTFTLAVEYILELLQPYAQHEFEHTLAVTFTNKATAEMKDRILETLYAIKTDLPEAQPYLDAIRRRAPHLPQGQTLRQQAGRALSAILHDYSRFRVETIDSFFQSILSGMARELGLAAGLQVELQTDEIIDSAVDSLIETMDTRPKVRRWVMDYVREQLDSGDKWDIVTPLKAFATGIFSEEYQGRSQEELDRISDDGQVRAFSQEMRSIRQRALEQVQEAVDEVLRIIPDFSLISYGKNLQSFLRKAREMKSEGPTKSVEAIRLKSSQPWETELQEAYAHLLAVYPRLRRDYLSASLALRHLSSLLLLQYIDECAHEIEGDSGRFTLSSTPALLGKMVEGSDAPFIFEKIGTRINYVMIDEFQDTSRMQWENFKKLLFEKLSSGGKGLLVGDIKQSIYRWRSGDWKILYGIEEERELKRFSIKSEPLDVNYRSHQNIVRFNNAFFPVAARLLDDIDPDAPIKLSHIYDDVKQKAKKADAQGFVRVKLYRDKEADDTIHDMAKQIRRLQADGLDLSQIAILVRTNLMAKQLIEGFTRQAPDIRLVSDEAFMLDASTAVQMLVAALRLLVDTKHSDIVSEKYLMLHYLHDIKGQTDLSIQDIALREAAEVLPEEFTAHREELLQLPLYLLVERLWRIFSLAEIEGEDVYVLTFFDELQNHLRNATPDIPTFLAAWDEKLHQRAVPGTSVAGVRILTIHKSKGLAFHTVMLPYSQWSIEGDRQTDILWCEAGVHPYDELGALPISTYSKDVRSSVFAPAYEQEHLERRVDALNTLYVAFTRAIWGLYIWGVTKPGTAGDLIFKSLQELQQLPNFTLQGWESSPHRGELEGGFWGEEESPRELLFSLGERILPKNWASETGQKASDGTPPSLNRLHIEHRMEDAVGVKVVTRNPALYFLQSGQTSDYLQSLADERTTAVGGLSQREMGTRMHEVLSRIREVGELDAVVSQARREGIIGEGKEWDDIVEHVREGFRLPLVASWFQSGNAVYSECAIASRSPETGLPIVLRPDRVVMKGRQITVIDYKFGHPSRHYSEQVRSYMNLMRRMYPDHDVRGYLWYVMGRGPAQIAPS